MKLTKLLLAGALGLAGIHQASAVTTTIHVVGSTAFRAATVNAIINRMASPTCIYSDDGSSANGANFCTISGTWPGITGTTVVECAWSGSVAGIQAVTANASPNPTFYFLTGQKNSGGTAATASTINVLGTVSNGGTAFNTAQSGSTNTEVVQPEVTMADNFEGSTQFGTSLTDAVVGIIPFAWVVSGSAPSDLTNIGPNGVKALWTSTGFLSAEILTGNPTERAHTTTTTGDGVNAVMMYTIGRDNLSGTRLNCFAETGVGINTSVVQYSTATSEGGIVASNTCTQIGLDTRIGGVNGSDDAGDGGESSGGTLADDIRNTTTTVHNAAKSNFVNRKIAFITYLGEPDSYRAVAGNGSKVTGTNAVNARYITYNGVAAFQGSFFNDYCDTFTGANANQLTIDAGASGSSTFSGIVAGQAIRGPQIPADTVVVSVAGNTITMSKNATAASSGTSATNFKTTVANLIATPIREGNYTFWSYEHIMWDSTVVGTSGSLFTIATGIRDQITSGGYANGATPSNNTGDYFAAGLANDAAMQAKRATDGGAVIANY